MAHVKTIKNPFHLEINKDNTAVIKFLTEHELNNFIVSYLGGRPVSAQRNIRLTYLE